MPNIGTTEVLILLIMIGVPIAVGYWCMTVFRGNGRSPGWGFALGFLASWFLPMVGAIIAVVIAYAIGSPEATGDAPAPPT